MAAMRTTTDAHRALMAGFTSVRELGGMGAFLSRVIDEGQVVGIFSERDALVRINTEVSQARDRPIQDFMTPNPRVLDNEAKVAFATQRMDLGGYRHVPIVDQEGELQGIISARDILRYLTDKLTAEQQAS